MIIACGLVGPLRVSAEDRSFCPVALQTAREALAEQPYAPRERWHVIYVTEFLLDNGRMLRGATQRSHRRIYVVFAEPRTLYHELHHAYDAEHGAWQSSLTHGH